ncbi:AI-2E family transporter [Pelagicoccus sp. SDUM812003]|uniref:AI-2E family transporter n=1 Tax=Pelagicoccus sp. SDUM812003 TaxID=3041267 RepID=UPI0028107138|nr:AI-2E family transporter [Pelagicoccus sp. SDUM812003]MDQ8202775.1 AI-2E family transporter [Pelagicoccus sp. SDUM812003]
MNPLLRAFLALSTTVIIFYILHIGKELIIPFVLAVFIWYLINVLSTAITRVRIKGKTLPISLRYIASTLIIIAALGALFNFITQNVSEVIAVAPTYQERLQPMIDKIIDWLPIEEPPSLREFVSQFNFSNLLSRVATSLASIAGNASIISIYVIFLFLEQRSFGPKIRGMSTGSLSSEDVFEIIDEIASDIRTYIGIKTLTSAITGVVSYGIMAAIGLDFAAFFGTMIFFLNFIPTIGSILATIFPSLLSLLVFDSPLPIIGIIGGVTATQVLVGNMLEPRLMGSSLNLSPLVILFSLSLWGALWGVTGMFLCVPITVVAMIVCSHFPQTQPVAILLSSDGKIRGRKFGDALE